MLRKVYIYIVVASPPPYAENLNTFISNIISRSLEP